MRRGERENVLGESVGWSGYAKSQDGHLQRKLTEAARDDRRGQARRTRKAMSRVDHEVLLAKLKAGESIAAARDTNTATGRCDSWSLTEGVPKREDFDR